MRKRALSRRIFHQSTPALIGLAILAGCIADQSNRGTVVDNEVRVGMLYLADGSPASHARVRVFSIGHVPDTSSVSKAPEYSTETDNDGRYEISGLSNGIYNILGELAGSNSFQDSVFLGTGTKRLAADTLRKPGLVDGVIRLQPNHSPLTAIVQVLGTSVYANVDAEGRFQLPNLAEGRYSIRVHTTVPEYTPLISEIRVVSGKDETLTDTLVPVYTGIPVVTGLRATYDTAEALIRLAWDSTQYRDFSEFLVYRDFQGVAVPGDRPLDMTASPGFVDTLLRKSGKGLFQATDTFSLRLEYRVRVRNKSDQVGLNYGNLKVEAAGPGKMRIRDSLWVASSHWDSVKRTEKVILVSRLRSPMRGMKSIRWSMGVDDSLVATHGLEGKLQAEDSLAFEWSHEGPFTVRIRVEDTLGAWISDSLRVQGNTSPRKIGNLQAEYTVSAYAPATIAVSAEDPDGDSLTYSLQNRPAWMSIHPASGTLSILAVNADTGRYENIQVMAGDGRRTLAFPPLTVVVRPSPWEPKARVPAAGGPGQAVRLGDKVYLFGGAAAALKNVYIYDLAKDSWSTGVPLPVEIRNVSAQAVDGRIFILGGLTWAQPSSVLNTVWAFDTNSGTWAARNPMPTARQSATSAVLHGRIYMIGGNKEDYIHSPAVEEYDPTSDNWVEKQGLPTTGNSADFGYGSAVALNGVIYTLGWDQGKFSSDLVMAYDPVADNWTKKASLRAPRSRLAACAVAVAVSAAGGYLSGLRKTDLEVYDPALDAWRGRADLRSIRMNPACAEYEGTLYLFRGEELESGFSDLVERYVPNLDN